VSFVDKFKKSGMTAKERVEAKRKAKRQAEQMKVRFFFSF
jgi:hypothetical protein